MFDGIRRYRKAKSAQDFHLLPPGQYLVAQHIAGVEQEIKNLQRSVINGTHLPYVQDWGPPICGMRADHQAAITLIALLNSAAQETTLNLALAVANQAYLEYKFHQIRSNNRDYVRRAEKFVRKWTTRKAKALLRRAKVYDSGEWSRASKVRYGTMLIRSVLRGCDLFEIGTEYKRGKTIGVIRFKPETWELVEQIHHQAELWRPVLPPMVAPPKDWTPDGSEGGYYCIEQPLIKAEYDDGGSQVPEGCQALEALNHLQRVPWKVNEFVLDTLQKAWDTGGNVGDLPPRNNTPVPPPPTLPNGKVDEDKLKEWKRMASLIHGKNARTTSRRLGFVLKLSLAQRFRQEPEFWLPHNFDWRGRIYPLANHLQYQSEDSTRALFLFKRGVPLGKAGLRELKIHIANCWGYDKFTLDARERWTDNRHNQIMGTCESPEVALHDDWWMEADSPWLFLAAIREYYEAYKDGDPEGYYSHLPVSIDGTCNGLQHYAALSRDLEGAKAVNVYPGELPSDLYTLVCNKVAARVEQDLGSVEEADNWWGKIDRKVCKRPAMTYAYGVTKYGVAQQLVADGHCDNLAGDPSKNSRYLAGVIMDCIPNVVQSADKYMDWLQKASGEVAATGSSLRWAAPSGFQPCQRYVQQTRDRIQTLLGSFRVNTPTPHLIDKAKQRRGLPPNFVHSLDASHMAAVTINMVRRGVPDLMMIHDSFGCHAAYMDTLRNATRLCFYEMYSQDIMEKFKWQVEEDYPVILPDLPPMGDLNLTKVFESEFFFS